MYGKVLLVKYLLAYNERYQTQKCFIPAAATTRTGTEGDKNTPKPGHGHGINTDKPKQNSLSHIAMKSIEFSFLKSIPDHILAKSNGHNSTMI